MAINIVAKLFRLPIDQIAKAVETLNPEVLTEEKLQALQKLLPFERDELQQLTSYEGDRSQLAEAEKFVLQLMKV